MSERITQMLPSTCWDCWNRGKVELYFKHRYKAFNYRIEKLAEYFVFPNVKRTLRDFFEMEAKVRA